MRSDRPGVPLRVAAVLCVCSAFLSAFLLFVLEPLIARMHLMRYGGSAFVWNTALVFFQAVLLLGYLYADRFPAWLGDRWHLALHAALLAAPLFVLPPALRWVPADAMPPVLGILASLAINAGAPLLMLASNTTLVQVWYARSANGGDPFRLYAASNAGSILGLLLYPLAIEPAIGVRAQSMWWAYGYAAFLAVSGILLAIVARSRLRDESTTPRTPVSRPAWAGWAIRAAIASSLLMSVTVALTTALGSTPLLWVVPLLVYLVTFVIAFSDASPPRKVLEWGTIAGIAVSMGSLFYGMPLRITVPAFLIALFFGALLCHSDIYRRRPDASGLPSFYLAIAFGGFAGGVFNAIAAPLLFHRISEFPITLAAVAAVIDADRPWRENFPRARLRRAGVLLPPLTMLGMTIAAYVFAGAPALRASLLLSVLMFGVLLGRHSGQFTAASVFVCVFLLIGPTWGSGILREERSFFGVSTVASEGRFKVYRHSGVVHGKELDRPGRAIPTAYYHAASPAVPLFTRVPPDGRIGAIGLGVGAVAAYSKEGQVFEFFEIDPVVARIARDEFSFLREAPAQVEVEIGDGRLLIARKPESYYDLVFIDAFSGGSIPLHLFTAEALDLYLRKCAPEGVVLFHISSSAIAFDRVLRGWSAASGVPVLYKGFRPTAGQSAEGAEGSDLVAIAKSPGTRAALMRDGWKVLQLTGRSVRWTDDHASALPVLRLGQ